MLYEIHSYFLDFIYILYHNTMAQSLSKVYIHLVFSTKNRIHLLPQEHLNELHQHVREIIAMNDCVPIEVGGTTNHIHILYVQSKIQSMSQSVRSFKMYSSKWVNQHTGRHDFSWQEGYGAFSISASHVEAVSEYIRNQEEHHKRVSFEDEFCRLCRLFNVKIDERYVWG